MNLLDKLFGEGGRPIRRDALFHQKTDDKGQPTAHAVEATIITLSPHGSIDHARIVGFLHCGHVASNGIGGQCTKPGCQNVSCPTCYAERCSVCFLGTCLEHKYSIELEGVVRVVCERCKDQLRRERRNRAIARLILAPFIDFNSRKS